MDEKVTLTDEEWRQRLTPEQYKVLRKASTERPFTGQYVHVSDKGVYTCAGCGAELFTSDTKFDSGTGWPSFYAPLNETASSRSTETGACSSRAPRFAARSAAGTSATSSPTALSPPVSGALHELLRALKLEKSAS